MIVRGEFGDAIYDRIIDECGPIRHFFANLSLCKHITRVEKTTFKENLSKVFHEAYGTDTAEQPESLDEALGTEIKNLTTEDHLGILLDAWSITISEYRVPFRSIMGVDKWNELCDKFNTARGFQIDKNL